jgi:hypothetical protein
MQSASTTKSQNEESTKNDEVVTSLRSRHAGESRGPELLEIPGFRLSPE